jgi:hypothetical protein
MGIGLSLGWGGKRVETALMHDSTDIRLISLRLRLNTNNFHDYVLIVSTKPELK